MDGHDERFQNSIHCFPPAPSLLTDFLHSHHEDFTFTPNSESRSSHSRAIGCWFLRSSNACLLWCVFYPKLLWSDRWQVHAEPSIRGAHQRLYVMTALNYPRPQHVTLLVDSRERVVIFTSLVILRGSLLFNYSWVSEEERERWRGIICCGTSKVITCSSHQSCKENSPAHLIILFFLWGRRLTCCQRSHQISNVITNFWTH